MPCTPTRGDGTINDEDAAALILPMAEADVTAAASDTPPRVVSPYGTDGDCSTAQ